MERGQIGKYKLVEKIGQGAMGEVFRALDPVLNRPVAIKTISASMGLDETLRKRFHREAQSAARLNHPNIITVYDFGEERGTIFMAMELLEGRDLKELIGKRELALGDKLSIMEQICDGLAFAHAREVIHRDLKPGNIHVQANKRVKIMDFGLARFGASEMTRTGMVMGTPNYMSPEQVRGEKADARSDVFALGSVFYELLANRKPFEADSMHAVLFKVLQDEPAPLRQWAPDLPLVLVQVVSKALCKDAAGRFQSAGELRDALRRATQAIAAGRGDQPLVGLDVPVGVAQPTPGATIVMEPSRVAGVAAGAPAVHGAMALDPSRAMRHDEHARPPADTLSGRGATHVGRHLTGARPDRPSRLPLYAGAAALVVMALVTGYFMLGARVSEGPPPQEGGNAVNALAQELVARQVELARKKLDDHEYKDALKQAERAVKLDPDSADARAVRDRAKGVLDELDRSAARAKGASTDGERAGALWAVLSIDPKHPLAEELGASLDAQFRGRAEEARRAMQEARTTAERGGAGSLESFGEGVALARDAEAASKRGAMVDAARKFLEAQRRFERARRSLEN
jgi:tRNA A-37 threonylcarbamoyl transferase component Bud32